MSRIVYFLLIGLTVFFEGCRSASNSPFAYPPTRGGNDLITIVGTEGTMGSHTIAVLPVQDLRANKESYEGYQLFAMLPLVPFSRGDNNYWETDTVNSRIFQNAIVSHIEKSRCARAYALLNDQPHEGEYRLRPKIVNGGLESYMTFYCLGIFPGCYVAILGAPMTYNWMAIEIEFELIAPNGQTIDIVKTKGANYFVAGEYYNWNPNTFLSLALCKSLNEVMPKIREGLEKLNKPL